jgi:hypothetical protein
VPVKVTVNPNPPVISVNPTSLGFIAELGSTNPISVPLSIKNTGGGTLKWTAVDDAGWLSITPTTANLSPGGTTSATVTVNPSGLGLGTHNANISISAPGAGVVNVLVEITITHSTS